MEPQNTTSNPPSSPPTPLSLEPRHIAAFIHTRARGIPIAELSRLTGFELDVDDLTANGFNAIPKNPRHQTQILAPLPTNESFHQVIRNALEGNIPSPASLLAGSAPEGVSVVDEAARKLVRLLCGKYNIPLPDEDSNIPVHAMRHWLVAQNKVERQPIQKKGGAGGGAGGKHNNQNLPEGATATVGMGRGGRGGRGAWVSSGGLRGAGGREYTPNQNYRGRNRSEEQQQQAADPTSGTDVAVTEEQQAAVAGFQRWRRSRGGRGGYRGRGGRRGGYGRGNYEHRDGENHEGGVERVQPFADLKPFAATEDLELWLVDSWPALRHAIYCLRTCRIIAIDFEGVSFGNSDGHISVAQMARYKRGSDVVQCFVFDLVTLYEKSSRESVIQELCTVMVNPNICKVIHDVRCDSRALLFDWNIGLLQNVVDVQVAHNIREPRTLSDVNLRYLVSRWLENGGNVSHLSRIGRHEYDQDPSLWDKRPLPERLIRHAAADVQYLLELWDVMCDGDADLAQHVQQQTFLRMLESCPYVGHMVGMPRIHDAVLGQVLRALQCFGTMSMEVLGDRLKWNECFRSTCGELKDFLVQNADVFEVGKNGLCVSAKVF